MLGSLQLKGDKERNAQRKNTKYARRNLIFSPFKHNIKRKPLAKLINMYTAFVVKAEGNFHTNYVHHLSSIQEMSRGMCRTLARWLSTRVNCVIFVVKIIAFDPILLIENGRWSGAR